MPWREQATPHTEKVSMCGTPETSFLNIWLYSEPVAGFAANVSKSSYKEAYIYMYV